MKYYFQTFLLLHDICHPMHWAACSCKTSLLHILFIINTVKTISLISAAAEYEERKEWKEEAITETAYGLEWQTEKLACNKKTFMREIYRKNLLLLRWPQPDSQRKKLFCIQSKYFLWISIVSSLCHILMHYLNVWINKMSGVSC